MEETNIWLLMILILVGMSAFLMAAETGMMAVSRFKLRHLAQSGKKRAELALKIIEHPEKLLGAILIGNNLVQAALSALITALAIIWFGEKGVLIATFMIAMITLFFCELVPKSYSSRHPETISLLFAWPTYIWLLIFSPIVKYVTFLSNAILRLMGSDAGDQAPSISEDELKTIIKIGEEEGVVPREKRRILHRVIDLSDLYVREVMVPRMKMVGIELASSIEDAVKIFQETGFSRIPVFRDNLENIVGVVHIKDIMSYWGNGRAFRLADIMRKPFFVPDSAKAEKLLEEFKKSRSHIAIVVDEYGGVEGLATMEDILEEIVGEIQDEHDEESERIVELADGSAMVDGSATIKEVNKKLHLSLPEDVDTTVGGFVMTLTGSIPAEKDVVNYEGIRFLVEKVCGRSVGKIRIYNEERRTHAG